MCGLLTFTEELKTDNKAEDKQASTRAIINASTNVRKSIIYNVIEASK